MRASISCDRGTLHVYLSGIRAWEYTALENAESTNSRYQALRPSHNGIVPPCTGVQPAYDGDKGGALKLQ